MNRRRSASAAVLLALLLPLPLAAAGTSVAADAPSAAESRRAAVELPRPTGRFSVGQETLHLVDRSRTDPWAQSGPRELMVTMRYPAQRGTGGPVHYLTSEEARLLLVDRGLDKVIPVETLAGTAAHSRSNARPVAGRYPLIVLSPGYTVHRATLTALAEDLASRGYVVAAVDHAYESVGTAFPGGRVLECLACDKTEEGAPPCRRSATTAAATCPSCWTASPSATPPGGTPASSTRAASPWRATPSAEPPRSPRWRPTPGSVPG
nr:hypothetical protein [Streptomyces sp. NBC_00162]